MVASNSINLGTLDLFGTYTENGQTQPTKYHLVFDHTGEFTGEAEDDDGTAPVQGTMEWPSGAPSGRIAWSESPHHAVMEVWGTITDEAYNGLKCRRHISHRIKGHLDKLWLVQWCPIRHLWKWPAALSAFTIKSQLDLHDSTSQTT